MNALRAAHSPTAAPAPRMSYIDLLNRFWQVDAQQKVAPNATRLYFFLVAECNRQRWTNPFTLADAYLCLALNMPKNTMKPARAELIARGLIAHQPGGHGAGDAAVYALQTDEGVAPLKVSKADPLLENKGSGMGSDSDPFPPNKGSEKGSIFDPTIYKEEDKTCSVVKEEDERAAPSPSPLAGEEKKNTSPPESPSPVAGTEGGAGRAPRWPADEAQLTDAAHAPLLNEPAVFQAACLDLNPAYAGLDFEHYRLEMRFDSLEKGLKLMPYEWRKRLRHWLANAKTSRAGLLLAAVPGLTKGDPRAIQPLATKSSASPTKKKSWS
jgi:hypothetical protein